MWWKKKKYMFLLSYFSDPQKSRHPLLTYQSEPLFYSCPSPKTKILPSNFYSDFPNCLWCVFFSKLSILLPREGRKGERSNPQYVLIVKIINSHNNKVTFSGPLQLWGVNEKVVGKWQLPVPFLIHMTFLPLLKIEISKASHWICFVMWSYYRGIFSMGENIQSFLRNGSI